MEMMGWVDIKKDDLRGMVMPRLEKHALILNKIRCFGCAACIAVCPIDVIHLAPPIVTIDEESCIHCELCLPSCPVHALSIEEVTV